MDSVPSDVELMVRIVQHDQDALSALYDRYSGPVFSLALRILRQHGQAEEITQDIFLKVWNQAEKWDPAKGQLISWLLTVTRFTSIDRLRREKRQPDLTMTPLDEMPSIAATHGLMDDPRWHDGRLLRALMKELPSEQAHVVELAFFQGMTHSQLADALNLPLGTVKTRVRLGLQKLKALWLEAVPDESLQ